MPTAVVESLHLGEVHTTDAAGTHTAGSAIHRPVVQADETSICGETDIDFHAESALPHRLFDGGQSLLGVLVGRPAMAQYPRVGIGRYPQDIAADVGGGGRRGAQQVRTGGERSCLAVFQLGPAGRVECRVVTVEGVARSTPRRT